MPALRPLLATSIAALVLTSAGCVSQDADSGSESPGALPEAVETIVPRRLLNTAVLAPANMAPGFTKIDSLFIWWYHEEVRWRCLEAVGSLVETYSRDFGGLRNVAFTAYEESETARSAVAQVLLPYPAASDAEQAFTVMEQGVDGCTRDRGYALAGTEGVYDVRVRTETLKNPDRLDIRMTGTFPNIGGPPFPKVSWSTVITQTANNISILWSDTRPQDAYIERVMPALLRISLARLAAVTRGKPPPSTSVPPRN